MNDSSRPYSLRKSRNILKSVYACYKKKKNHLPTSQLEHVENEMTILDHALLQKNSQEASRIAKQLESFSKTNCKKSILDYASEFIIALILALVIATIVRQVWFELYEIPTGSMRPTFREKDHLTVTKTAFGINLPLATQHLYFDPNLVQRGSILIFSGEGLPIGDTETTYFFIFPSTKRYIKRNIAKPGDSVYFYGGQLYAIDANGKDIAELRNAPWMKDLEYVPFLSFEGEILPGNKNNFDFLQMHQKIGRLSVTPNKTVKGEIFNGKEWVRDQPLAQKTSHDTIQTYSDFLGMRNYAMARLLTKDQLRQIPDLNTEGIEKGILYLQLIHTPNLAFDSSLRDPRTMNVGVATYSTIIPLQQKHLDALMDHMYTARFVISNSHAKRYTINDSRFPPGSPIFTGVPDGTYEFYHGKGSQIYWQGIAKALPKDHPLYSHSSSNVQKLFNLGIEMNNAYSPSSQHHSLFPHRYAYFRNGDLYLLGAPILKKEDSTLIAFNKREQKREAQASAKNPYVAFKDYGPPIKNGAIDSEFIRAFGITIPEKNYLVLGDNHAMSSDSRVFGFVPEENIQGAPSLIIWPPGERLGPPSQKPYPIFTLPRVIVWTVAALILCIWYALHRRSIQRPIFVKESV